MLGLFFCSKLDWDSYIASIATTFFKKIGTLILSIKILYLEVALYLCKSTIRLCYKDMLDKPQKQIPRTAGSSLL